MLADIELAQTLQAASEEEEKVKEVPHPLDRDYQLLRCQLQLLDPEAPEYKVGWASRSSCGTVPLPTAQGPLPLAFLPVFLGLEESTAPGGPVGVHPCLWSLAGDPHLLDADWQLQEPGATARLESEPRRGGEGSPGALPIPALTGDMGVLA